MEKVGQDQIIIATAGHVDHGKTTLIKALTGIETDTTALEKKRGLTINLGFAFFDLPHHQQVGIVDVPGHAKFLKNMIAGLSGVDLVLLVIDAAEGVMPQTREHLAIMSLLGIDNYIVVLSKIDTVDAEFRALAEDDVRSFLAEHHVSAPIIGVDAVSGKGLPQLIQVMDEKVSALKKAPDRGQPRLNVDRAFSIKGFGTIVTGTLLEGKVTNGMTLEVFPSGKKTKIRNIQVHDENMAEALPGTRTALNLANLKPNDIKRGDVLTVPDNIQPTWMLDVAFDLLPQADPDLVKLWRRVRVYLGAREIIARVVPLGESQPQVGQKNYLQLRLEEPVAVKKNDRYILRAYSPMPLLGGGKVLNPNPAKHRRFDETVLKQLTVQASGDPAAMVVNFLANYPQLGAPPATIADQLNLAPASVKQLLHQLQQQQKISLSAGTAIEQQRLEQFEMALLQLLNQYHQQNPLQPGMPKSEISGHYQNLVPLKVLEAIFQHMQTAGKIRLAGAVVAAGDFKVQYNSQQKQAYQQLITALKAKPLMPPNQADLIDHDATKMAVLKALEGSEVIRLSEQNVMLATAYQAVVEQVTTYLQAHQTMTLAQFRDLTGASRKYGVPILEYMDKQGITQRQQNQRVLKR